MGQRAHDVLPQLLDGEEQSGERNRQKPPDALEPAHFETLVNDRSVHQESGKAYLKDDGQVEQPVPHALQKSSMKGFN